jgi:hypothetical protein
VDFVASVFRLSNRRGYSVPAFNFGYLEKSTGIEWRLTCGGTRAYMVRFGNPLSHDLDEQAAESHFMMRRVTAGLLLCGFGLFEPEPVGRMLFTDIIGEKVQFTSHLDNPNPDVGAMAKERTDDFYSWVAAISTHTVLRRAAEDAHAALMHPHEALIYVYRGLEWLVVGMNMSWEDLGRDIGATPNEIRELKKTANVDTGTRHATKSGSKLRADPFNYGTWVIGLFDAINVARTKLEPGFNRMTGEQVGEAVARAVPHVPFE